MLKYNISLQDKMMFCDHCDRGYHTYCVGVSRIPTGRWECSSCNKDETSVKKEIKEEIGKEETKSEKDETESTKSETKSEAPTPQPPRAK